MHQSFVATMLLIAGLLAAPPGAADLRGAVEADYESYLEPLFIHFHRNPELSFREFETAKRIASELRSLGIEVTEGIGQTGVVGMLENGTGPMILVRADMDGLPIKEDSGLPYQSEAMQEDITGQVVPVMHACGHDVHITALIGAARQLAERLDEWSGTVMFVAQPAEERISGAKAMLEDGLYERFGVPDYAVAFHVAAGRPAGKVSVRPGLTYSSSDSINITVRGVGAHGASPHRGKDPIYIASQLVVALQGLVSRELSPLEPGVVTVGAFNAGFKHNIIPDRAELQLTVRADSEVTRAKLLAGIERVADGIGRAAGLPDDLLPVVAPAGESTPTTNNDPMLTNRILTAFRRELGDDAIFAAERTGMGAEDFAYLVQTEDRVPGVYFSVGGTSQADLDAEAKRGLPLPSHHSPFFRIEPEPSVVAGTHAMIVAVLELLGDG
ncbi:MAG: amidohydrolase [Pseudomonadota bacterium]